MTLSPVCSPRPLTDVTVLRRIATALDIPPPFLGLSSVGTGPADEPGGRVPERRPDSGGDMRRRELLASAATIAGVLTGPVPAAADGVAVGLDSLLFDRAASTTLPASLTSVKAATAAARADFQAVRYRQLAARLPRLIQTATATLDAAPVDGRAPVNAVLAEAYTLATRLAIKLHEQGLAWAMADRTVTAAVASADPATVARAHRTAAVLRRSAHHAQAQQLLARAAHQLRADTGLRKPADASLYASMLATAAYTAARADRRDEAWTLADEAGGALTGGWAGFGPNDLTLYQAGIARALGDYGQAVDLVLRVRVDLLPTPERRARYAEDAALAWIGRGRPVHAYEALREAERIAPQEVRYRPWAHQVTTQLLADGRDELPGLRAFATRIGLPSMR